MFWNRDDDPPVLRWRLTIELRSRREIVWLVDPMDEEEEKEFWQKFQGAGDGLVRYRNTMVCMGDVSAMMLDRRS